MGHSLVFTPNEHGSQDLSGLIQFLPAETTGDHCADRTDLRCCDMQSVYPVFPRPGWSGADTCAVVAITGCGLSDSHPIHPQVAIPVLF